MQRRIGAAILAGAALCLVGCGEGPEITLTYASQARVQIPAHVRSIAIGDFVGSDAEARKWGEVAADKFAALFDECNRQTGRYKIVSRRHLKAILDEHKIHRAFADPGAAQKVGKIAKVDAVVCGNVTVTSRDERVTKMRLDPMSGSLRPMSATRRTASATVSISVVQVSDAAVLLTRTATREYDSEKNKKGGAHALGRAIGVGVDEHSGTDEAIADCINQCVSQVCGEVTAHETSVKVRLAKGRSSLVDTGNKLAAAGDYAEALAVYLRAIEDAPDDDGALFNAGVMSEGLGRLDDAEKYYTRAFQLKPEERYVFARKRVRDRAAGRP